MMSDNELVNTWPWLQLARSQGLPYPELSTRKREDLKQLALGQVCLIVYGATSILTFFRDMLSPGFSVDALVKIFGTARVEREVLGTAFVLSTADQTVRAV